MAMTKFAVAAATVAATLSMVSIAGCTANVTAVVPGSTVPSNAPSSSTSATPSATPTTAVSAGTTVGASATPAPTGIPSTPDTSSRATVQGVIYDDLGTRLDGATVTGKLLGAGTFDNGSDTLSMTTQIGSYALNGAPTGSTILVTASKAGFTKRQQTIVPLANLQGNTTINNVTFGGGTDRVFPLSDKPEVVSFTPSQDATGVSAATTFTLNFNEPVNTADVDTRFALYVAGPIPGAVVGVTPTNTANNSYQLSVSNTKLNYTYDPNRDNGATTSTATYVRNGNAPIYDSASFTSVWSNNNQTVTFKFRTGVKLPTDKDSSKLPQYAVSFKDGSIRDAAGTGRSGSWFRISPAQIGRVGFKFTVAADTTAPTVTSIGATNADVTVGSTTGDRIKVTYSEMMALYPGNMGGAQIPAAADTGRFDLGTGYMYYVSPAGTTKYPGALGIIAGVGTDAAPGVWQTTFSNFVANGLANCDLGGTPAFAKASSGDATRTIVELTPRTGVVTVSGTPNASQGFAPGSNVWVNTKSIVTDPAGNTVNTANNVNIRSGIAQ
ncbi:MAG: Ig-like domain-containing protein [Candidatus Sericytochromatia bacterium]|nr:Ig-like domain-containing protein [Candidatus Sericytochromatia bacterium]